MEKINIYIGFDSSNYGQELAYEVCKRSILKHNLQNNVKIHKLVKKEASADKVVTKIADCNKFGCWNMRDGKTDRSITSD